MLRRHAVALLALLAGSAGVACHRPTFSGAVSLLSLHTDAGALPRAATLALGGETRAALVEPASFTVDLPARPLLTLGVGLAWSGDTEAPGWYHLTVRAAGRVVAERTVNPRAL